MSDDETGTEEMRDALSAIAQEMQNFHSEPLSSSPTKTCESAEMLGKLIKYKSTLGLRRVQVKKLRQNLKTACLARTMSTAKASETASLNSHLNFARTQYLDLYQQQNEKIEQINKLTAENQTLCDQLQCFNNIIQLGYNELQKIRSEPKENVSTLEQLKHIIVCCGQYYADHCNEQERCNRLEHKNRFLNNRILIMENHLQVALDELRNVRITLKHHNHKNEIVPKTGHCIGVVCSEYHAGPNETNYSNLTMTKIELNHQSLQTNNINMTDLDLTTHLKTVKKLLHDQENLIRDLRCISSVLITEESFFD
ncbi:uncharacterized protein LOC113508340 isoform X2 [Trichoplusia ni]|uniref:Uncharacterized protein LOC113508340 isoform X2 n=1 Tax=Trichoplusia ni TaxID=7111 RepID=A0A7E5X3W0_TRINI|nr:uncharacterized protein LOC113508340 isoform X2 [Trichoplusia ni]